MSASSLDSERRARRPAVYEPVREEVVSAERFIDLIKNHRSSIKRYAIKIPRIGEASDPFGTFAVEYSTPRLVRVRRSLGDE